MMIDTIKKFVKYDIFESTTDNYDYAIVDNTDDFFNKYYLTDNTITYNGMKLNCYSGSRFFFDNGEVIRKSDITCYGVSAEYYVDAMEKLEKQRKIKLEKAEKLSIAKTVLKSFDGMVYNKKIRKSLAEHGIYLEVRTYSLEMYYASNYGSSSEYLFSCGVDSGIFEVPKGGKKERFYYTEELQDALFNEYNNANSEAYEIAKILDTPENYFKLCAKMNKLHEDYVQQINTLRNNISTDWDVMNILDNTVIDFKFK